MTVQIFGVLMLINFFVTIQFFGLLTSMLIFQVILHSEVKATLTIFDAWLDLQDGFVNTGQSDGRPTSAYFPLVVSPNSRAGILFSIRLGKTNAEGIGLFVLGIFLSFKSSKLNRRKCIFVVMSFMTLPLTCNNVMFLI